MISNLAGAPFFFTSFNSLRPCTWSYNLHVSHRSWRFLLSCTQDENWSVIFIDHRSLQSLFTVNVRCLICLLHVLAMIIAKSASQLCDSMELRAFNFTLVVCGKMSSCCSVERPPMVWLLVNFCIKEAHVLSSCVSVYCNLNMFTHFLSWKYWNSKMFIIIKIWAVKQNTSVLLQLSNITQGHLVVVMQCQGC